MTKRTQLVVLLWVAFAALFGGATSRASAVPASGDLELSSSGLPRGWKASITLGAGEMKRHIQFKGAKTLHLPAGHYSIAVNSVTAQKSARGIRRGAVAFPEEKKLSVTVVPGGKVAAAVAYRAILNPGVKPLPARLLNVIGDAADPAAILLPSGGKMPAIGTIYTAAPDSRLPRGLISKVTDAKKIRAGLLVSLEAVPVTDAVPNLQFEGALDLQPAPSASHIEGRRAREVPDGSAAASASPCTPPKLNKFKAHLDSFELRQASLTVWPPQMRLTMAIRTTESLSLGAAAVGINCDWTLAELGPFQGAIPVGPVAIPVYAKVPVRVGTHVNGRLDFGTVNVASTTLATAAAGVSENRAALSLQGTNVWTSGLFAISGSARLYASVGVQAGIGVAKGANTHADLGFGPEFEWNSGSGCGVYANLGSLSAGVSILGKDFNSPKFTPLRPKLWTGCSDSQTAGGSGTETGGGSDTGTGSGGPGGGSGDGNPSPGGAEEEAGRGEESEMVDTYSEGAWNSFAAPRVADPNAQFGFHRPSCGTYVCVVTGLGQEDGRYWGTMSTYDHGQWTHIEPPLPANSDINTLELGAPVCSLNDICVAAANRNSRSEGAVLESYSNGGWHPSKVPVPITDDVVYSYVNLGHLACSSSGICVGDGSYASGTGGPSGDILLTYADGEWNDAPLPTPLGADPGTSFVRSGFVCGSGDTCLARGSYVSGDQGFDSIIQHTNGTWSAIPLPEPSSAEPGSGEIGGLGCSPAGLCIITGDYWDTDANEWIGMLDTLSAGTWHSVPFPIPDDGLAGTAVPSSTVECTVDTSCSFTEAYQDEEGAWHHSIVFVTGSNAVATALKLPNPSGLVLAGNDPPMCSSRDYCIDIRYTFRDGNHMWPAWIDSWNGTSWSVEYPPSLTSQEESPYFSGSGCSATGFCLVELKYGYEEYERPINRLGIVEQGNWSLIEVPVPPNGVRGTGSAQASGCTVKGICVLVGSYLERPPA